MKYLLGTIRFRPEEGGGPNVNTLDGFTKALVTAGGGEVSDEAAAALAAEPDRSIAGGLTTESQEGQGRDDLGRFAATPEPVAEEPAAEPAEGAAPAEPEPEPSTEPLDPLQKQLSDAQEFIGRQGQELGTERQARQHLEERIAALEAGSQEQNEPGFFVPDDETWDSLGELFDQVGGPGMMARVAGSNPDAISAALSLWKAGGDVETASAYLYEENVNRILEEAQGSAQPVAPELPPEIQSLAAREKLAGTFNRLAAGLGEKGPELAPHVGAALADAGPLTQQAITEALASDDPARHEQAFNEVVRLAEAHARGPAAAAPKAEEQQKAAAVERKQAAQVASGSRQTVTPGQTELPKSQEEFAQIKETDPDRARAIASELVARQFTKTESTSVADGLTYGDKP